MTTVPPSALTMFCLQNAFTRQLQDLPRTVVLLFGMSTLFTSAVYPASDSVSFNGKVVRYWAFHLQGAAGGPLDLIPLQNNSQVDLAVIDYSRDASEQGEFSSDEIQTLKDTGKVVLAYMPIGAADAGRFYDQNPNDTSPFSATEGEQIVGPENPSFPGTFFVKFWFSEWQNILFGVEPLPAWVVTSNPERDNYLDRILGAGFDGTYLDDIDGYQQFNLDGDGTRPTAALEMVLFIQQLSSWVKAQKPDFLVFPQNAESVYQDALGNLDENGDLQLDASDPFITVVNGGVFLDIDNNEALSDGDVSLASMDTNNDGALSEAEIASAYFNSIDGLGAEDFFFKGNAEEDNPFVDTLGSSDPRITDFKFTGDAYLDFAVRNIPIFNVEYLTSGNVLGLQRYCEVLSDQFSFTNLEITTDNEAPGLTDAELKSLTFIPFQAPSRALTQLSTLSCGAGQPLYFAQFGNGQGLTSEMVLTNPSATDTASGEIDFFDDNGLPLSVGIAGTGETTRVDFSVLPLGAVTIATDGQGEVTVGSAVVGSDNRLGGVVRFNLSGIGITGVPASQPLAGFITPVRRKSGGINTGIAIYNTSSQAVLLNLTLRDTQGTPVPNGETTIEAFPINGHLAQFIGGVGEVLFPNVNTDDFQGTLVVRVTGGNVAAAALELGTEPGQFTTLPVTPLE